MVLYCSVMPHFWIRKQRIALLYYVYIEIFQNKNKWISFLLRVNYFLNLFILSLKKLVFFFCSFSLFEFAINYSYPSFFSIVSGTIHIKNIYIHIKPKFYINVNWNFIYFSKYNSEWSIPTDIWIWKFSL